MRKNASSAFAMNDSTLSAGSTARWAGPLLTPKIIWSPVEMTRTSRNGLGVRLSGIGIMRHALNAKSCAIRTCFGRSG